MGPTALGEAKNENAPGEDQSPGAPYHRRRPGPALRIT